MSQRRKRCSACGGIPVSGKTWSLLVEQDALIKRLREEIARLKEQHREELRKARDP